MLKGSIPFLLLLAGLAHLPCARAQPARDGAAGTNVPEGIGAIHDRARQARERRAFDAVDELRRERQEKLKFVKEQSAWTAGVEALTKADALIKGMQYTDAARVIKQAWQPFASDARPRDHAVFGDIAVKMFEVHQAALAIYPEGSPGFPKLTSDEVKRAIDLAIREDPCQVEAIAIEAFLTRPNPEESFQPAELQESLRRRNTRLLDITFVPSDKTLAQPWHAPVEFLKAKSTGFVLDDLRYIDTFLLPTRQLLGKDGRDEPFAVVLGGALLSTGGDSQTEGRGGPFFIDEYVAGKDGNPGRWVRMRPRWLTVRPTNGSVGQAGLVMDFMTIANRVKQLDNSISSAETAGIEAECRAIATKYDFPTAHQIPQQVMLILAKNDPLNARINDLVTQFGVYVKNRRDNNDFETARKAEQAIQDYERVLARTRDLTQSWQQSLDVLVNDTPPPNTPSPPRYSVKWLSDLDARRGYLRSRLDRLKQMQPAEAGLPPQQPGDAAGAFGIGPGGGGSVPQQIEDCEQLLGLFEVLKVAEFCKRAVDPRSGAWVQDNTGPKPTATGGPPSPAEDRAKKAVLGAHTALVNAVGQGRINARQGGVVHESVDVIRDNVSFLPEVPSSSNGPQSPFPVPNPGQEALPGQQFQPGQPAQFEDGPKAFFEAFARECANTFAVWRMEIALEAARQGARNPDTWELRGAEWRLDDFSAQWRIRYLAELIDRYPRIVLRSGDLEAIRQAARGQGGEGGVPLQSNCSTVEGNPLVRLVESAPVVSLGRNPIERLWQGVVLTVHDEDQPGGPKGLVAADGKEFLWFESADARVRGVLNYTDPEPHIAIEYPGVEGRVVLGAVPSPFGMRSGRWRYLRDRRGNRIEIAPATSNTPLRIVSSSGQELVDRSVNYSVKDWTDLDRNVVNEFLPWCLALSPSLPTWQAYQTALRRPQPPIPQSSRWSVPRPAFRNSEVKWAGGF
jgi:hypothetical protein